MSGPERTIIFISTGRTGTKFFAELFARHYPGVHSVHASPGTPLLNILTNMHKARVLPAWVVRKAWERIKHDEISNCPKPVYLDVNNHLYAFVTMAADLYPSLSVVNIIRDPRTYVRSHLSWARERRKSYVANFILPFWQPNGFLLGEYSLLGWLGLSQFERYCFIWRYKNHLAEKEVGRGEDLKIVKFEDFFGNAGAQEHFDQLVDHLGLERVTHIGEEFSVPSNPSGKREPAWESWGARQCAQMDRICGELMRRYGYGEERTWTDRVEQGYAEGVPRAERGAVA